MPSPFPGMDPFLEHPARWPGVHLGLISALRVALNALLPKRYVADAGERLYVVEPERSIYPDVLVVERPLSHPAEPQPAGTTAVAAPGEPVWMITAEPEEVREPYVEIVLADDPGRVVTVIELLSPSNKASGHPGREKYRRKQAELVDSRINLLELDFLRRGEHTVAAPEHDLRRRGRWDYLACLHRGARRYEYQVWPISLRDALPHVCVPLADGEPEVILDLQSAFDRFYDENAYARRIDYRQDTVPPLEGEDREWALTRLRETGLQV